MTIFNNPNLTLRRRALRAERPPAERLLWTKLQGKQLLGFKFRRQHGIGPYFVDFYCVEVRLAVEVDGASHDSESSQVRDQVRDAFLESLGIMTIRFLNQEVVASSNTVAERIGLVVLERQEEFGRKQQDLP